VDEQRQTAVSGIFACGNVLQVHDLVDYVSDEAELAGQGAANYVKNHCAAGSGLSVKAGNGVRYVLPQRVNAQSGEPVSLFLRVTEPFGKVRFTVTSGDKVLATANHLKAVPGEMVKITLPVEKLCQAAGDILVSLEVRE
jgi:hypothetical protein